MRVILAMRPPREAELVDDDLIWIDARGKTISRGRAFWRTANKRKLMAWHLVTGILGAHPLPLTNRDLMNHIYGDREDGGAECSNVISVRLAQTRKAFRRVGIVISGAPYRGYRAEFLPIAEAG